MILSPAERSFLHESLALQPPLRPDGRKAHQFRPMEAKTAFLPNSNGSARIRMADGSECIVSIKSKVVLVAKDPNLVECDVDVSGFRDDSNFVSNLKFSMTELFVKNFPTQKLHLTSKYAHKLFVDCVVVSHVSYPLTMMSMAAYLALCTTRIPLLVSAMDDAEAEEQPTFDDDWERAILLKDLFGGKTAFEPPLLVTFGSVGGNVVVDPSVEEEQIIENGFLVAWHNNKVISPVGNINLATNSSSGSFRGTSPSLLLKAANTARDSLPHVVEALNDLVQLEADHPDAVVF